jgi:hypothetical protein
LLGSLVGNIAVPLAYLINASNGFLVTILAGVAEVASALPFAAVETPGATLPLIGLFYLGCVPAAIAEATLPKERWPKVAGALVSGPHFGLHSSPYFGAKMYAWLSICC